MADTSLIGARVSEETKAAFRSVAEQQGLSESALLKQLLAVMVGQAGGRVRTEARPRQPCRDTRLTVRLRPDDQRHLCDRAAARSMKSATYVSALVRSHLSALAPIPKAELQALSRTISELGAVGRNLNQIARAMNQGARVNGPSREELRAILKACTALRDHVRDLVTANLKAWEAGYDKASD
jgi:hypothetical protein